MILFVDVGNTRIKWRLKKDSCLIEGAECHLGGCATFPELTRALGGLSPEHVVMGSVATHAVNDAVLAVVGVEKTHMVKVESNWCDLHVAYSDPARLGVDRWLAMIAAYPLKPVVVIDAGSAITVDFIDQSGSHLGGMIAPGFDMMRRSLFSDTSAVKVNDVALLEDWSPGGDTIPGVESGLSAMIRGFLREVCDSNFLPEPHILITGGDAEKIAPMLDRFASQLCPGLVLDGLEEWWGKQASAIVAGSS